MLIKAPPPQLAVSDLRIDVVMLSQLQKVAFISEVSYAAAQERKIAKYLELVSEVEKKKNLRQFIITLKFCSELLVCVDGFKCHLIQSVVVKRDGRSSYRTLQSQLSKDHHRVSTLYKCGYSIYTIHYKHMSNLR